jgi:hypothetical protein
MTKALSSRPIFSFSQAVAETFHCARQCTVLLRRGCVCALFLFFLAPYAYLFAGKWKQEPLAPPHAISVEYLLYKYKYLKKKRARERQRAR